MGDAHAPLPRVDPADVLVDQLRLGPRRLDARRGPDELGYRVGIAFAEPCDLPVSGESLQAHGSGEDHITNGYTNQPAGKTHADKTMYDNGPEP